MANEITKTSDNIEDLFNKVSGLIEQARSYVKTSVNTAEIYTKYYIGKYIVEYEQKGNVRAQYGKQVIKDLSKKLTGRFGEGWSADILEKCRKLFVVYSNSATVSRNLNVQEKSATVLRNFKIILNCYLFSDACICLLIRMRLHLPTITSSSGCDNVFIFPPSKC